MDKIDWLDPVHIGRNRKMFFEDEKACCCGHDHDENEKENCGGGCDCGCDCGCEENEAGDSIITMTDTETGEEYSFVIADDFAFEDEHYCVLVTMEDEREPEMIITKVVTMEDGSEGLMSLDDAEYDRVYAEYERLCEEDTDEDEGDEEEE
jgi:hypothetical protein